MTTNTKEGSETNAKIGFKRVLFATDFSTASENAFGYASSITRRYHADLYVAHVINLEPVDLIAPGLAASALEGMREQARKKIESMLATRGIPPERYHITVGEGTVAECLTDLLRRNDIDVCVLGTHGRRAFKKLILGSIAEEVFRVASCPVLTVGPQNPAPDAATELRHILYPVEFAPDSSQAASYAVSLAERYGAKLTLFHVSEDMPASQNQDSPFTMPVESWIDDHVSRESSLRRRIRFERGFGSATKAILDFASDAQVDVIVIGIRPFDPVIAAHLPKADTAYELISRAPCPVLTVR